MRRVRLMLARAVVNVINDGRKVQNLQVGLLDDEESDEVERLQNYGHFSVPLPGAEALIACVGAQRDQGIAVVVEDRRYRPTILNRVMQAFTTTRASYQADKRTDAASLPVKRLRFTLMKV
ncbi:baseplate assembly protein [Salmonella enterica subsp. enterica]|nr:baseplate assembly protein [Salmonella enterica subsp. enterica]